MQCGFGLGATPNQQSQSMTKPSATANREDGESCDRLRFDLFFQAATTNQPYGYQCRLACGAQAEADRPDTLRSGTDCHSQLINIPTGLGKTAAVVTKDDLDYINKTTKL